ncbi:MAG: hypothetical protein COU32_00725 [Candidatus Magasanikbacteria bacterium CG10_big_fil_rev_8_21_14_0_10_42_10]|uniref:DUF998 domain-containing protein n=2 Tax=Candidatus Magasanikiibacteriota TaxID=1752731 RepID=A0A2H0TYS3_9BACT|nr:MAG: hypothetical protein COU32_00725 [Candidatus Magasanikbacteria bacterium CG10_big_fil_rev_8_21_14_0_10_42_10]PIZ92719.1 MAG: hypothetical protein COX82_04155 [Candidatus Magasanikbacteria bacterium CG_4_10_14_0_2_um_filter_41_10]
MGKTAKLIVKISIMMSIAIDLWWFGFWLATGELPSITNIHWTGDVYTTLPFSVPLIFNAVVPFLAMLGLLFLINKGELDEHDARYVLSNAVYTCAGTFLLLIITKFWEKPVLEQLILGTALWAFWPIPYNFQESTVKGLLVNAGPGIISVGLAFGIAGNLIYGAIMWAWLMVFCLVMGLLIYSALKIRARLTNRIPDD